MLSKLGNRPLPPFFWGAFVLAGDWHERPTYEVVAAFTPHFSYSLRLQFLRNKVFNQLSIFREVAELRRFMVGAGNGLHRDFGAGVDQCLSQYHALASGTTRSASPCMIKNGGVFLSI